MADFMSVEGLDVYMKLCHLHIEISALTRRWPRDVRFELASQVLRSSNRAPAQLAENNNDRHARKRVEGANRARGEVRETDHHLFIAQLKGYITEDLYRSLRLRYHECVRMLNGLECTYERDVPPDERRWPPEAPPNAKR